ncbi:MAG: cytochrome c oxidase accessory protein CcoG [Myxococcales bacterium]|nr:cytochrome c oxidase accessory protein CcoG [Myxococcales bacterium]
MLDARPVQGRWRRLRWGANAGLIVLLFAIPWIRVGGEPLVLLDIPARKFHVFGLVIFPQELYFLWLIVAGLALSLFFFTALAGRLWCGWACPQTVFTDVYAALARRIQRWKGSTRPVRVPRWRKALTHGVWLALSGVVGFHLVGYFRSPYDQLTALFHAGEVYRTSLAFQIVVTLVTYLDFAIVRQTFCKYLCPYARFQEVLFDRDTLVIGYDSRRGEPRGKRGTTQGDCVNCGLCVAVCPTGIDIRNGMQLECIACTQCIDACNGVMQRLGRARNLIGYRSLVSLEGLHAPRVVRPRVLGYGALLLALALAFAFLLEQRQPMDLQVAHNAAMLFSTAADGRIGNAFTLHIENRDRQPRSYRVRLEEAKRFELVAGLNPIWVPAIGTAQMNVFVLPRAGTRIGSADLRFVLEPVDGSSPPLSRRARYVIPGGIGAQES